MDQLKVGVIGGSGLGQLLGDHAGGTRHEAQTPFGKPSDAIIETEWAGVPVFLLARHGPGHLLNPSKVPYRANIFALKELGCTHILASGAVGSLREELKPRDLVIPEQVIDKTQNRPGSFYENSAVHVEFSDPFCPVLRQMILEAAELKPAGSNPAGVKPDGTKADEPKSDAPKSDASHAVHGRGCYVAMEGQAFSTRAESLMHRLWGGDVIGMTAMPEAKLAREAEISYALVALVTDFDSWRPKPAIDAAAPPPTPDALLQEIIGNLQAASANAMDLIRKTIELLGKNREAALAAPSRHALRLAIWSDKSRIHADEVSKLKPLWGRYLSGE